MTNTRTALEAGRAAFRQLLTNSSTNEHQDIIINDALATIDQALASLGVEQEPVGRVELLAGMAMIALEEGCIVADGQTLYTAAQSRAGVAGGAQTTWVLDEEMATLLLDTIGIEEPSAITLTVGDGHSGHGLYVHLTDLPEEGAIQLVATAPSAPATQPAGALEVGVAGLSLTQEPKYTVNGSAIVNRASGEAIPADEPVFIFRARDKYAVDILERYAANFGRRATQEHYEAVVARVVQFRNFAHAHPERMKVPDTASPTATAREGERNV